jgi:hypothetical protein
MNALTEECLSWAALAGLQDQHEVSIRYAYE